MDPHQAALVAAAAGLGIQVEDLSATLGHDVVRYRRGERSHVVREGKIFESLSSLSEFLCQEKHVCKAVLSELDVPAPAGIQFEDAEVSQQAIQALLDQHAPLVLKPSASEGGDGVRVGLRTYDEVRSQWQPQRDAHARFVLEQQIQGVDLRIHVLSGRIVAACTREAAFVVGDGTRTVHALVEARQAVMRSQNPENRLELDEQSDRLLAEQGLGLDAVPEVGRKVVLKTINNLALGGVAVDVTDELHADYARWARDIAARFGLDVFAVDALTKDPTEQPRTGAHVIELNAKPDWLHHTFSERRQHDMPRMLLEHVLGG